jgi:hypothetical protein
MPVGIKGNLDIAALLDKRFRNSGRARGKAMMDLGNGGNRN